MKFTKIWKDLLHTELFLFWLLDVQNNFMFPTYKNSRNQVKNQKLAKKQSSFDGLIQKDIDLPGIYLAVKLSKLENDTQYCLGLSFWVKTVAF